MSELELTRDLLMDAGGHKEMKAARQMHRSGLVREASYENGVLSGTMMIGGKLQKVRMEIHSRTHMENKCTCFMTRRDGRVCAHAVAVGLEVIEPTRPVEEPAPEPVAEIEDRWPGVTEEFDEESNQVQGLVMLPLQVGSSWERGQMMMGFGVEFEGEEQLLSEWGPEWTLCVGEADAVLLETLKRMFPGAPPGVATLGSAQFLQLLEVLAGHPRVSFGRKEAAQVSLIPLRPKLVRKGQRLVVNWPEGVTPLVEGGTAWALCGTSFRPVGTGIPDRLTGIFARGAVVNPIEARAILSSLGQWFEVEEGAFAGLPEPAQPVVEVSFEGSLNAIDAQMAFSYGTHRRRAGNGEVELLEEEGRERLTSPDLERVAEDALRQWGFDGPGKRGEFALRDRQAILQFYARGLGRLDPEWKVVKGERFSEFAKDVVPVTPVFELRGSGEDWFSVELEYLDGNGEEVSREEVRRLIQMGRTDRPAKGGRVAVLDPDLADEVAATLADCEPLQEEPGVFRIDLRQAAYLKQAAEELGIGTANEREWTRSAGEKLELGTLGEVLRPYQAEGVAWLWNLAELKMGGILADDMGLGKTLQTLAFLKARGGQALVVCPSSLIYNWMAEAQRFVPELKAVAIEGPKRMAVLEGSAEADLLVTSYALLRIDVEHYRKREFEVVVLDEAQQIKNPEAQVSKAAFRLPGKHRFALTGTPIENSVKDLWSIMNFVMPGYLGDRTQFVERFEKPLGQGGVPELQRRLARRLKPVVKRRLKREVAADLPEKIEQVRYCELTAKQRKVYETILSESRSVIHDAEGGKKRILALTALLRLRQACCDLRLLHLPEMDGEDGSVKMEELERLLLEAAEGGHRVLVFSQFVQMLQGMVPMLAGNGLEFCYLDGQTKNRGEVVTRFQESAIPVFLISLKAGGVGLNLTGADTVIHVDPWWNPAVEAQATDRAHRIGQERVVTSYKLITRNTVEEKILALQERKKEMIRATLDAEFSAGAGSLSEEEIFGLFG